MKKSFVFCLIFQLIISGTFTFNIANAKSFNQLIRGLRKTVDLARRHVDPQTLRNLAAMGILIGTVNVEKRVEQNVLKKLAELQSQMRKKDNQGAARTIKQIDVGMERDMRAVEILTMALNLAMNPKLAKDNRKSLSPLVKPIKMKSSQLKLSPEKEAHRLETEIRTFLLKTHEKVNATIHKTLKKMESIKKSEMSSTSPPITSTTTAATVTHMNDITYYDKLHLPQLHVRVPIYQFDVESLYRRFRRQNDDDETPEINENKNENSEFDDDDVFPMTSGNGGIGGLFASLSGGEGGSDVGALLGAISGVITNLFGPGGLDIPSLLSTGTSLIAGLLSGDENFGTVLANYIGISVEGLSGGGGAENNGIFFGNFIGTLLGSLSSDPEEEGGPKPQIFFDSFKNGFEQTKQKRGADKDEEMTSGHKKSYFFEFISNIVSSLVGGITNLILNSSVGSSGGSSQGSADLSSGSSQGSHTGSAHASKTSTSSSSHKNEPNHTHK